MSEEHLKEILKAFQSLLDKRIENLKTGYRYYLSDTESEEREQKLKKLDSFRDVIYELKEELF